MSQTNLVHRTEKVVYTDSLIIAKEFGKRHDHMLTKIKSIIESENSKIRAFGIPNYRDTSYIDKSNRENVKYEITEDGFLELAMSFTGDKAREIRIRFIEAFRALLESYAEPQRTLALKEKRSANNPMMAAIKELRADQGKDMRDDIYWTESKLCNFMVINRFIGVCKIGGEDGLTNYEVEMLSQVRKRNECYILAGLEYKERKAKLIEFRGKYRLKNVDPQPRLPLLELV